MRHPTLLRHCFLNAFLFPISFLAYSQNKDSIPPIQMRYLAPSLCPVDTVQSISNKGYLNIVDKNYSSIATGLGQGVSLSDYGAVDPVAGTFSINFYRMIKWHSITIQDTATVDAIYPKNYCPASYNASTSGIKNWYLNITGSGSIIGNNTAVLFDNSKFNSGLTITAKLHIPVGKCHGYIFLNGSNADTLYQWKKNVEYQRWAAKKKIWDALQPTRVHNFIEANTSKIIQDSIDYFNDSIYAGSCRQAVDSMAKRMDSLKKQIDNLGQISKHNPNYLLYESTFVSEVMPFKKLTDSLQKLIDTADSLSSAITFLKSQNDSARIIEKVVVYDTIPFNKRSNSAPDPAMANYGNGLFTGIDNFYDNLLDSLELKISTQPYLFKWVALVASYNRNNYFTYYDTLPFSERLTNNTLNVFNYGVEFNVIRSNLKSFWYLNMGLQRIRNNNIGDLNTSKLNKLIKTNEVDTTLSLSKDYNVYTDPIKEYDAWKPYVNYYYIFDKAKKQAVHLTGDAEFRGKMLNPVSLGAGYIFSFKNSKDNSILNTEVYIKFIDIFKSLTGEKSGFINRNLIGIQFGIPFSSSILN